MIDNQETLNKEKMDAVWTRIDIQCEVGSEER